jgi:hypothetical protein
MNSRRCIRPTENAPRPMHKAQHLATGMQQEIAPNRATATTVQIGNT